MIKIENVDVSGFEAAIRGARNPLNSWDKSDSYWTHIENPETLNTAKFCYHIGDNDLALLKKLAKAGPDHAKFARMINVTMDITAPMYFWKQAETYKVGTVTNSCSTMHKIHSKPIEASDFSIDDDVVVKLGPELEWSLNDSFENVIADCEMFRQAYEETGDKKYWRALVQLLPEGYMQKRTIQLNYEVLRRMYFSRKDHKLQEWHDFCDVVKELPWFADIFLEEENNREK